MNVLKGVLLKTASALLFAVMAALIRYLGQEYPLGQVVFFRSAFAILPVVVIYAWRRELALAVRTRRFPGHVGRGLIGAAGMFFTFGALARLPLAEATALSFAAPLITVALAALLLKERVRIYRWSAVAVGFGGVVVMLLPHLDPAAAATRSASSGVGAVLAIVAAFCSSAAVIQTRRLTDTETTPSIVFYFSLVCSFAGLATLPLGWRVPDGPALAALVSAGVVGGVAQIFLTESYRYAPASVIAPFDYTTLLWAFGLGYLMFGEVPPGIVFVGAAIVTLAGLFVLWRERQLGLMERRAKVEGPPTAV